MSITGNMLVLARGLQSSLGRVLVARSPVVATFRNFFLRPSCGTKSSETKVNRHGFFKNDLKVLDESGKDLGIMKRSQLKITALERGMKVVCVDENATPHPIYKLVSEAAQREVLQKSEVKPKKVKSKNLVLNSTISQNDLSTKIENVFEWLKKDVVVNVKIQYKDTDKECLDVYKEILEATSSIARISQSIAKANLVFFSLSPLSENQASSNLAPKLLTVDELKTEKSSAEKANASLSAEQPEKTSQVRKDAKKTKEPQHPKNRKALETEVVSEPKAEKTNPAETERGGSKTKGKNDKAEKKAEEGAGQ